MDTVTESQHRHRHGPRRRARASSTAIFRYGLKLARSRKVKKFESGMIADPITVAPDQKISDAQEIMHKVRHLRFAGHSRTASWSAFSPTAICVSRSSLDRTGFGSDDQG